MMPYFVARSWNGETHHQIVHGEIPPTIRMEMRARPPRAKAIPITPLQASGSIDVLLLALRHGGVEV